MRSPGPRSRDTLLLGYALALGFGVWLALDPNQALVWDNGMYYWPFALEACRQLRHGLVPAWNPFVWSGAPLLAELPTQALYPPTWLACLFSAADATHLMALSFALHFGLAALGMILLCRALSMSRAGAALAATVFAANPFFAYLGAGFIVELAVFAWLPWMVLCAVRASTSRWPVRWVVAGAIVSAAAWLAGQAQLWAYCAGAVVVCSVGFAHERRLRAGLLALLVVGLGVALVLFQVLPFVHLVSASHRAKGFDIGGFLFQDIPLASWPALFTPGLPGAVAPVLIRLAPNNYVHLGTVATALAAVALLRPNRLRLTAAGLAVLGLWLAAGRGGGLMPLLYSVPGMALMRNPFKFFIWPVYGIALLAGFGLTDVERGPRRGHAFVCAAAAALGTLVWCTTPASIRKTAAPIFGGPPIIAFLAGELALLAFVCLLSAALRGSGARFGRASARWLGPTAVGATVLAFAMEFSIYVTPAPPLRAIASLPPGMAREPAAWGGARTSVGGFRAYWAYGGFSDPVPGDLRGAVGTFWRAEMTTGYTVFTEPTYNDAIGYSTMSPQSIDAVKQLIQDKNTVLDVLSNRYTFLGSGRGVDLVLAGSAPHHVRHEITPKLVMLENTRALPRMRFVDSLERVGGRAEAVQTLVEGKVDPAVVAVVEAPAAGAPRGALASCEGTSARLGPAAIDLDLDCPGDAFAVLSERFDDGWFATRDGAALPLQRAYGLVLGLALPPGRSHVEVRYRAPGFVSGLVASSAVAVALALAVLFERRARCGD